MTAIDIHGHCGPYTGTSTVSACRYPSCSDRGIVRICPSGDRSRFGALKWANIAIAYKLVPIRDTSRYSVSREETWTLERNGDCVHTPVWSDSARMYSVFHLTLQQFYNYNIFRAVAREIPEWREIATKVQWDSWDCVSVIVIYVLAINKITKQLLFVSKFFFEKYQQV